MSLSGSPLDFLWAFLGGVLVSFTPCVYPLLPITVAYIGASSSESKIKGFSLSLIYVTGISITYSALGLVAVLTGSIFGQFSSQPQVHIIAGLVICLFGFSILRGPGFKIPGLKLPMVKRSGTYLSCLLLGLASGLIISPCVLPVLAGILAFVATKRNFIYGGFLLFCFAYGMGLLLILAGTFSSILSAIPKSGYWMEFIKKFCAAILIAMGLYFVISGTVDSVSAQDVEYVRKLYDFSLKDIDGREVTLSEFKNKSAVVLFFWTTRCPYCVREMQRLNEIYPDLVKENIEVLAINVQESESRVKRFLSSKPVAFKVLLDYNAKVAYAYGVVGVPKLVFINKEGEIIEY